MGWRDRPYAQRDYDSPPTQRAAGIMGGMPRPGRVVKWLLIVNVAAFFLQLFLSEYMLLWLTIIPVRWWEPWRYLTFQFLHGGMMHILFNMIGLYFLGMMLESGWGSRRFLIFYLCCGGVAGLAHVVMAYALGRGLGTMLLGASGGVYAVVLACAVFYPQVRVIVFLFPMPIRFAAALFLGIAVFFTLQEILSNEAMRGGVSNIAHLGGAAAAAAYIWVWPALRMRLPDRGRAGAGRWERKLRRQRRENEQVDRILDKIRRKGLRSLNWQEKRTLRKASRRQEGEDRGPL